MKVENSNSNVTIDKLGLQIDNSNTVISNLKVGNIDSNVTISRKTTYFGYSNVTIGNLNTRGYGVSRRRTFTKVGNVISNTIT